MIIKNKNFKFFVLFCLIAVCNIQASEDRASQIELVEQTRRQRRQQENGRLFWDIVNKGSLLLTEQDVDSFDRLLLAGISVGESLEKECSDALVLVMFELHFAKEENKHNMKEMAKILLRYGAKISREDYCMHYNDMRQLSKEIEQEDEVRAISAFLYEVKPNILIAAEMARLLGRSPHFTVSFK